ncbi:MAG TPA: efflux RND transporter periplasmic adaptor subunit [Planctomycetaceae bacterium]|jgi:RND family efflux transporter MFP subunit|nr:efflux RND transporter periplasmic adaptor subunit [Planctomycetaceae bacterium]
MSEQEFELYLKLLSRCLNLTPGQREQIADELRDHLAERLEELAEAGVPREKAVVQALDEFGDAAVLAGNFATVARLKRRRFLMRLSLGSVGALTAVLLVAFAFWPENRAVRGPERIVAQEKPIPAAPAAQKAAKPNPSTSVQFPRTGAGIAESATPPVVEVCHPVTKEVTDYQTFSGNVQPSQLVQIRTRATGYLRKVYFRTGQVVKQGELLFEIDPATYQIDVDKARAEVERADAKLTLALSKASRAKELHRRGEGSGGLAEETEQECQIARADLQIARANRESAQLGLAWTRITAPIGGYISRSSFDVGSLVKAEESALATIACLDPVYAAISMDPSTWFALRKRIQRGEFRSSDVPVDVSVEEAGDLMRKGQLEFVDDAVFSLGNPQGATTMRVRVPNRDAAFVTGLSVQVRYGHKPHPALLIPAWAFGSASDDRGRRNVWVVGADNTARLRWITNAPFAHDGLLEITEGLKPDEWIVCNAAKQPLADGKRIEPKLVP